MAEPFEWSRRARRRREAESVAEPMVEPVAAGAIPPDTEAAGAVLPEPAPPAPRAQPAGRPGAIVLGGRYELGETLGSGGEATVRLARDLVLGRDVAVKLFRSRAVPASRSSLEAIEARVAAALNHYALTTLIDAGVDTGPEQAQQVYLVMEYVQGESLKQRLQRGPMTVADACWLGFDIAEGLDYMHQAGFLHRDVKPANVLISSIRSVRPVVAKVTDFGITSRIGQAELSTFTVGTAAYLSPEQVEGRNATPESDIYSLGLVLLEAITGHVEYPGTVEESAFERLVRDPVVPDDVPRPVADLLRRMTARAPRDRVGLHELAVELQQFLADDLLATRGTGGSTSAPDAAPMTLEGLVAPEQLGPALELAVLALGASRGVLAFEDGALVTSVPGAEAAARARTEWRRAADEATVPRSAAPSDVLGADPAVSDFEQAIARRALTGSDGRQIATLTLFDRRDTALTDREAHLLERALLVMRHDVELRLAMRRALFQRD
ncbi:MAG: serine/threonine-protein kinase [Amnibacterium sp.]